MTTGGRRRIGAGAACGPGRLCPGGAEQGGGGEGRPLPPRCHLGCSMVRPSLLGSDSTASGFIFQEGQEWREVSTSRGASDGRQGATAALRVRQALKSNGLKLHSCLELHDLGTVSLPDPHLTELP